MHGRTAYLTPPKVGYQPQPPSRMVRVHLVLTADLVQISDRVAGVVACRYWLTKDFAAIGDVYVCRITAGLTVRSTIRQGVHQMVSMVASGSSRETTRMVIPGGKHERSEYRLCHEQPPASICTHALEKRTGRWRSGDVRVRTVTQRHLPRACLKEDLRSEQNAGCLPSYKTVLLSGFSRTVLTGLSARA